MNSPEVRKAPNISWQTRVVIALSIVVLIELYFVSRVTSRISDFAVFASDTCALLNDRTVTAAGYYADGVGIYSNFARAWRSHGYPDIASNWDDLAFRDRLRVQSLAQDQSISACAKIDIATPPPIQFLPLTSAPPSLASPKPKGTP